MRFEISGHCEFGSQSINFIADVKSEELMVNYDAANLRAQPQEVFNEFSRRHWSRSVINSAVVFKVSNKVTFNGRSDVIPYLVAQHLKTTEINASASSRKVFGI